MDVEISREGYIHHDRYERGVPVVELENGLLPKIGKTKKTGTKVNFLPDPEIFEKTRFKEDEIKSRMHETAYLNPKLTIIYEDRRGEEVEHIMMSSTLKGNLKALPWKLHSSTRMNFMRISWDSVIIFLMPRVVHISRDLKPYLQPSLILMRENLVF